ncbi:MAG: ABC transporter transmembrane domain-containing protein, partial [Bdellovibrionaceae bacterium]|nr:ABC transporter transmembrane domain-containing protein [Pseudobdellovibrionaceae bacterium]
MGSLLFEVLRYRWPWRLLILVLSGISAFLGLVAPFLQKEFVDRLQGLPPVFPITDISELDPATLIILAAFCFLLSQLLSQLLYFIGARESMLMQKKLASMLYGKMLQLRADTMSRRTLGEVVSLYAVDVPGSTILLDQTLPMGASTFFPLVLAPLALIFFLGFSPTWVVSLIALILLINFWLARRQAKFFIIFKSLAAKRLGYVNEWIQNIRTLRILGWVPAFEERIFSVRRAETENRVRMVTNGQLMNAISSTITFILNVVALTSALYWSAVSYTHL